MADKRLVIGTDGGTSVVLADPRRGEEGWAYFVVELHATGLDVVNGVSMHAVEPLSDFWRDLESNWRGWSGERRWASTEPGLSIVATNDGRHVETRWTAVDGWENHWSATLGLTIEPGEQLSRIARDIEDLLDGV